jgi:hypothetical protein
VVLKVPDIITTGTAAKSRQNEGDFVGNHLGDGSQPAQQGIFIPGGPPRHEHRQGTDGTQRKKENQGVAQKHGRQISADRQKAQHAESWHRHQNGRKRVNQPISGTGYDVLFEQHFDSIRRRLQQTKGPYPIGTNPILDPGQAFTLQPSGKSKTSWKDHDQWTGRQQEAGDQRQERIPGQEIFHRPINGHGCLIKVLGYRTKKLPHKDGATLPASPKFVTTNI